MKLDLESFEVKPGEKVHLDKIDPDSTGSYDGSKDDAKDIREEYTADLRALQERLYAEHKHAVLVILQGMDTSGKDGTIEHVFEGVNPQGVRVATFKAPNPEELSHDFLWRVHRQVPAKGEIAIFNRSQYEDVLIVRVHNLVPENVWSKRYEHINEFEHLLADEGTTILKFFLHISKDEQKQRLLDRLDQPDKTWKFNPEDLKEREAWDQYMKAYEAALEKTSTEWAPWYIVPANHKWFRNLLVASVLVKTLKDLNPQAPETMQEADIEKYRKILENQ